MTDVQTTKLLEALACFAKGIALLAESGATDVLQQFPTITATMLTRKEAAIMFGISVSKFDSARKIQTNGKREIHLDPVPGMGSRVLFHKEKIEAEIDRWKKKRNRG